jgi:hypothetical protein
LKNLRIRSFGIISVIVCLLTHNPRYQGITRSF